jgi:hypothetical protein
MGIRVAVVLAAVISLHEHCPTASAGWGNVDWRLSSMRTRPVPQRGVETSKSPSSFDPSRVAPGCSLAGGVVIFGVAAG